MEAYPLARPELRGFYDAFHPPPTSKEALPAIRSGMQGMFESMFKIEDGVSLKKIEIENNVVLWIYSAETKSASTPVVLGFHGGGGVMGVPTMDLPFYCELTRNGFTVVSVEYRLAPEHPYPAPIEDAKSALDYVLENASTLQVLPDKLSLWGCSFGGWIASTLAIKLKEKGIVKCVGLDCPWLEHRFVFPSQVDESNKYYILPPPETRKSTNFVYGEGSIEITTESCPFMDVGDVTGRLTGLPRHVIVSAALDSQADVGFSAASKLKEAKVPLDFYFYSGCFHAFESFCPQSTVAKSAWANFIQAFKEESGL